jgi:inosine/xanthosine triphosphatase
MLNNYVVSKNIIARSLSTFFAAIIVALSMKTILVASFNPVKLHATLQAFQRMFPGETFQVKSVQATSGVAEQPFSDEETLRGASTRAIHAKNQHPEADYWVGIEGGVEVFGEELAAFAWVVIFSRERRGKGRTGTFFLPPRVAKLVREGNELGEADDIVFGRIDSKRDNGAIGLLSGDVIDRTHLYEHAVVLALISFKNPGLYTE